jgi:hypothetical protein
LARERQNLQELRSPQTDHWRAYPVHASLCNR